MEKVVLQAETTTALTRTTAHQQFKGRAFGFFMLNNLVPIVLNVRQPGGSHVRSILMWQPLTRKHIPYQDMGLMEKCCRKVYTFNIRHWLKCYLSDPDPEPYTFNQCRRCGQSVVDDKGHTILQIVRRSYRRDRIIYKADCALQKDAGSGNILSYQERANSRGC